MLGVAPGAEMMYKTQGEDDLSTDFGEEELETEPEEATQDGVASQVYH